MKLKLYSRCLSLVYTLKTSPVEIAAPYFSKNSAKIPVLEAASILTNKDGHFREDGKKIVEYKVDWDEHNFSPVRARRDTNTLNSNVSLMTGQGCNNRNIHCQHKPRVSFSYIMMCYQ